MKLSTSKKVIAQVLKDEKVLAKCITMEQHALRNVNDCLNTNIYSYLVTFSGQSFNLYFNVAHFSTPAVIRHLWQLKTVVFQHWHLIRAVLL
jgi:hypothetical protein